MSEIVTTHWSSEPGPRMRGSYLVVIKDGKAYKFTGSTIPGVVAVQGSTYHKNGKWSHTRYTLRHRDTTRLIPYRAHFDSGYTEDGLAAALKVAPTWDALCEALGVPEQNLREVMTSAACERLDAKRSAEESL